MEIFFDEKEFTYVFKLGIFVEKLSHFISFPEMFYFKLILKRSCPDLNPDPDNNVVSDPSGSGYTTLLDPM